VSGRKCPGLHCPGCGDGDGLGLIALVVALAVIGAIIHAIWRTLVEAVEIAALTVLGAAALAAIAGIAVLVHRARQNRPRRPVAARPVYRIPPEPGPQLSDPYKPAIEPARLLTPGQFAAIVTQRGAYPEEDR
jgi:hypothetical protein